MNRISSLAMFASLSLLGMLSGCGGGGSESSRSVSNPVAAPVLVPASPTAPATGGSASLAFSPNYSPDLSAMRRWDKPVVTVRVIQPAGGRAVLPLIQRAADAWNARVGATVALLVTNDASADISVDFVDGATLPVGSIGRTDVTFRLADQVLQSASVRIDQALSDDFTAQVAAHEFGHALGVEGHSPSGTDLMFKRAHLPLAITTPDTNTVLWGYSLPLAATAATAAATRGVRPDARGTATQTISCE